MRVIFRADASVQIGTGHIIRCLTLADELTRKGHECRFICRDHLGHLGELISGKGYEVLMLQVDGGIYHDSSNSRNTAHADWLGATWQQDLEQTVEGLTAFKTDWLVVDHYALDARWEQQIAKVVGRVMVIDDLADRNHVCSLLLDQNLGRNLSDYDGLVPKDCQLLIGPEYALLRPEFAELRERSLKRRVQPELKRILITMGGVDRTNLTGQVLDALAATELPRDTQFDIIMGAAAPYLDEVKKQAVWLPFDTTVNVNVKDIAERMCLADLAIGAVGGTSWERCCLGLPSILVVLADNQKSAAKALRERGAAIIADGRESVSYELARLVNLDDRTRFLARMAQFGAGIVEGSGCTQVVNELIGRSRAF